MPTISREESDKSKEFIKLINGLMCIIDDLTENIPEGEYLKICSHLKDIHGYSDEIGIKKIVFQNEVVATNQRRTRMRVRPTPRVLSDAEKLASGNYRACEFCDKIISNSWYDTHIVQTEYCSIARNAKKLAISTQEENNSNRVEAIAKIKSVMFKRKYPQLQPGA